MTYSIVARESCSAGTRFGVGVTTNNPGIGLFVPFVSEHGVVATQYRTYGDVGPQLLSYLADGLRLDDAVSAVLNATDHRPLLQLHALDETERVVHHGDRIGADTREAFVFGDCAGERCSVAGNCLENTETLHATAEAFEDASEERELADRLIEALAAGDEAGGDGRDNDVRSAAIVVVDPAAGVANEWYNDVRVDASPTPLAALREQYERAKSYHEEASAEWTD